MRGACPRCFHRAKIASISSKRASRAAEQVRTIVAPQIAEQHAESREMAGRVGDDDPRDAQFARDQRPRAAARRRRRPPVAKSRGIETALGRHPAHHVSHAGGGDAQDALGRRGQTQPERHRDPLAQRARSAASRRDACPRRESGRRRAARATDWRRSRSARPRRGRSRRGPARRRRSPARRAARRPSTGRCCRRRCRPPGCRSSGSGSAAPVVVAADQRAAGHQHRPRWITPALAVVPPMSKAMAIGETDAAHRPWCR